MQKKTKADENLCENQAKSQKESKTKRKGAVQQQGRKSKMGERWRR
jgi:hypothetical protein